MAVECPYCSSQIQLKGAKPGRYHPACPKCGKKFVLTVPQEGEPAASAAPPPEAPAATDVTMPSSPPPAQAAPAPDVDATMPSSAGPATTDVDATMPSHAVKATQSPADPQATAPTKLDTADHDTLASSPGAAKSSTPPPAGGEGDMPDRLGGYEVIKELGRGGMGAVYLARQVSLDRQVAVKVMNPQWARNQLFLSRFTREAYAAAQLVHHNVVQIYDIGEHNQTNFFSMEFVEGQSVGDMIKASGKIDTEEAVGYVLQAARGLKFAHDRGMIHRDIKPDNLMINTEGIVKVADLGLVKTPSSDEAERAAEQPGQVDVEPAKGSTMTGADITQADQAMGTPAYMPPEQAANAAGVDHRADIYSLGCTLYVMITGRPVFQGTTAMEVMSKHASEPVVRPDMVVKRVVKALADIIMNMVAKSADDRFQSMDEVIKALEDYLGIDSTGPFTPREQHAAILEESVAKFNGSKVAAMRRKAIAGFFGLCAVVGVLGAFKSAMWLGMAAGLALLTALAYFVLTGITKKTFLFAKTRQFVFGASIGDWLMAIFGFGALLLVLFILGWLWWWVGVAVVAAGLAVGFHATIDRKVAADRKEPIEQTQTMLKSMRLLGLEEDALRQFVCRYAGERWEAMYEALFDYESKMTARAHWGKGDHGRLRKKHGAWRDPLIEWMDAREQRRKQRKEQKHLAKLEREALKAKGVSDAQAQQQADKMAQTMVSNAADIRHAADDATIASVDAAGAAMPAATKPRKTFNRLLMEEADERGEQKDKERIEAVHGPKGFINFFVGARARFIVGTLLIAACALWMHQNGMLSEQTVEQLRADDVAAAREKLSQLKGGSYDTLRFPGVPENIRVILSSFNAGLAGLILVIFAPFRGVKMALFVLPATAVILLGESFGFLEAFVPPQYASLAAGGLLIVLGLLFGRRKV